MILRQVQARLSLSKAVATCIEENENENDALCVSNVRIWVSDRLVSNRATMNVEDIEEEND